MKKEYNFGFGTETYSQLEDRNHVAVRNMYIDYHLREIHLVLEYKSPRKKVEEIRIPLETAEKIGLVNWSALKQIIKMIV